MDKKRINYLNNRRDENYDRVEIVLPKGKKQIYKAYARHEGKTLSSLINELLENEVSKSSE